MADFNQVTLVGRLTRDPELKTTPGGSVVVNSSMAIGRRWFDKATQQKKEETTYVDITAFGRTAELVNEYCTKGSSVLVCGQIRQDSWEDKTTGQKRSKLFVMADSIQFLDSKRTSPSETAKSSEPSSGVDAGSEDVPF